MKRRLIIPLFVAALVVGLAGGLHALPYVYLNETGVNPGSSGSFLFPTLGNLTVLYGEYDLSIDWDLDGPGGFEAISGFCVENAYAPTSAEKYELLDPGTLGSNYLAAAYLLDLYRADGPSGPSAQAVQIAIWEAVLDPTDLKVADGNGIFHANFSNDFVTEAQALLDAMDLTGFTGAGYAIARNPVGSGAGEDYQDYVIHIPDASTLLLLGSAFLVGFGALGRKKRFNA